MCQLENFETNYQKLPKGLGKVQYRLHLGQETLLTDSSKYFLELL